ncbi:ribokinase [Metabacillus sp. JX24]|uniref:ribokinase n=1 Tax=Metabacillus sp. JX24 TaxID=3240759 RepID=UPI00350F50F9
MKKIAVIGSLNMDLVAVTEVSPKMGETVFGKDFSMFPGGKGANQATAAGRLGAQVMMFGTVGDDDHGRSLLAELDKNHVDAGHAAKRKDAPTGCALIESCRGQNRIIVIPGANSKTDRSYLEEKMEVILEADVILLSMEIPLESIEYAAEILSGYGKTVILNPAPAVPIPESLIDNTSCILPNEHEAAILFNMTEEEALRKYPNKLLITKGEQGVVYHDGEKPVHIPAVKVNPVDSTGAGDTFAGAFAAASAKGLVLKEAVQFAAAAAGLSVEKHGAQSGMPTEKELEAFRSRGRSNE